jgi:protein KRI1
LRLLLWKTLNALRSKDDSIYDKDKKFFENEDKSDSDNDEKNGKATKKQKPKRYKDLVREEILEKMAAEDGGSGMSDGEDGKHVKATQIEEKMNKLAYDEEQKALRAEFMNDSDGDSGKEGSDDDDDWLVKKKGVEIVDEEFEKKRKEEIEALSNAADDNKLNLSDPKGEIKDGDKFLLDFVTNKRWVDHDDMVSDDDEGPAKPRIIGDDGNDSDASLQDLNRMDDFESKYNFRFEEATANSGAGLSVVGYSRAALSDTIRRKDDNRKLKREQRKERKAAERKAKEEKLKRLKNAKKEELEERISQIKGVLGGKGASEDDPKDQGPEIDEEMVAKLMEGDFDPDKFEDLMSKMYSDDFYQKEESEWKTDSDVKASLKEAAEEEGSGLVINEDAEGHLYDNEGEEMVDDGEYDEDYEEAEDYKMEEGTHEKESKLDKKLKARMLDELYKLDYEDIIGDMPTRFKYKKVEKNRYGLTSEEILFSRDTSLKQFVSLNRMAPYDEDGEYVPGWKKRQRFREMSKTEIEEEMQKYAPAATNEETEDGEPKKKRRRQKKGKKKEPSSTALPSEETQETTKETESKSETVDDQPKAKRSRKKKGKKLKKGETNSTEVKAKVEESEEQNTNEDAKAEKKTRKRERKGKSKKKSKKQKVDGVSSSRLASYGF